jgi:hypothetical protein
VFISGNGGKAFELLPEEWLPATHQGIAIQGSIGDEVVCPGSSKHHTVPPIQTQSLKSLCCILSLLCIKISCGNQQAEIANIKAERARPQVAGIQY